MGQRRSREHTETEVDGMEAEAVPHQTTLSECPPAPAIADPNSYEFLRPGPARDVQSAHRLAGQPTSGTPATPAPPSRRLPHASHQ